MKVLYKEPNLDPEVKEIESGLKSLQELVKGYIECVRVGDFLLIVNEEGKLKGMMPNLYVEAINDLLCGPIVFVKSEGADITGLEDDEIEFILSQMRG